MTASNATAGTPVTASNVTAGTPVTAVTLESLEVRAMTRKHLRAVLKIEEQVYHRPWSQATYVGELKMVESRIYLAGFFRGRLEGYAGLLFQGTDGHVATIAVDPAMHGNKIAERLLYVLVRQALERGARDLTLEVRVSNEPAISLYRKFGFVPAGMRKNYYSDINEDALIMWANDVAEPAYGERLERLGAVLEPSIKMSMVEEDDTDE